LSSHPQQFTISEFVSAYQLSGETSVEQSSPWEDKDFEDKERFSSFFSKIHRFELKCSRKDILTLAHFSDFCEFWWNA